MSAPVPEEIATCRVLGVPLLVSDYDGAVALLRSLQC